MSSQSAVDYMFTNSTIMTKVVNSKSAMKELGLNEYATNKLIQNDEWRTAALASSNAIAGLDESNPITIPTMTSNTAPSGTVFASSENSAWSQTALRVFDGNTSGDDYWDPAIGATYDNQYVGYSFTSAMWPYKLNVRVSSGKQNAYYIIEATNNMNDTSSWIPISEEFTGGTYTFKNNSNSGTKYQHYRIRCTRTTGSTSTQSGGNNSVIHMLQIYGK